MKMKSGRIWGMRGLCLMAALCLMWAAMADEPPAAETTVGQVTEEPTATPTAEPTEEETEAPTEEPEEEPTEEPEEEPTEEPTEELTEEPEEELTEEPKEETTEEPTEETRGTSTDTPTDAPTDNPAEGQGTEGEAPSETVPGETPSETVTVETPDGSPTGEALGEQDGTTEGSSGDPATEPTQTQETTPAPEEEIDEDPDHFEYADDSRETVTAYTGSNPRIRIPDGVKYIDEAAFMGNEQLEEVYLSDTLEEIGDEAFSGCKNLRIVGFNIENPPSRIGSQAFHDCPNLIRDIKDLVEAVAEEVAEDAFDEVPPTPTPTTEPDDEEEDWEEDWDEDWEEDIEWETTTVTSTGGKKSTQPKAPQHARSGRKMLHDYDQVLVGGGETAPMQELTLGGEKLALSLKGEDEKPAMFTAAFAAGNALWDGKAESMDSVDTLMLRATAESGNRWSLDGTLLRQLNKTGIDYIMFRDGTGDVIVPTEGFLAGWEYEEMRRRGVAGRKFEYTLTTGEQPGWVVTVEGKTYEISEDSLSPIYLTGVTTIPKGTEKELRAETENGL